MRHLLLLIALVALLARASASDSDTMENRQGTPPAAANQGRTASEALDATEGVPANEPDPATGGDRPTSRAQVAQDLTRYGDEVQQLRARLSNNAANMENLIDNVIELNQETMVDAQRAKAGVGWTPPGSPALPFELGTGAVSDIDYPEAFPSRPSVVRFTTGGRNQLAGLNQSLKRASRWMNKHTCGGFNWTAQFRHAFRTSALLEYLEQLPEGVAAALPMALIGAFSPQLAEIVKHLKLIASFDISAAKADCHAIESALTSGLRKDMWGEAYAECLERYKSQGIRESMANCKTSTTAAVKTTDGGYVNPNGSQAASSSGWLTDSFSTTQDKLHDLYANDAGDTTQTGASALANSAANGGLGTGGEQATGYGIADAENGSPDAKRVMDTGHGAALQSLADTLWGSVRVHASGALEIGRKHISLFGLRLDTHAARLRESIQAQLMDHFAMLIEPYPDRDDLRRSYELLKSWTFQSRGAGDGVPPWVTRTAYGPSNDLRITDETMDACAYLLGLEGLYAGNAEALGKLKNEYRVDEFLVALAKYECWIFVTRRFEADYQRLKQLTARTSQGGNASDHISDAERASFDNALRELHDELGKREAALLGGLYRIASFRPQLFKQMYQPPGSSPTLSLPASGFVSE